MMWFLALYAYIGIGFFIDFINGIDLKPNPTLLDLFWLWLAFVFIAVTWPLKVLFATLKGFISLFED